MDDLVSNILSYISKIKLVGQQPTTILISPKVWYAITNYWPIKGNSKRREAARFHNRKMRQSRDRIPSDLPIYVKS